MRYRSDCNELELVILRLSLSLSLSLTTSNAVLQVRLHSTSSRRSDCYCIYCTDFYFAYCENLLEGIYWLQSSCSHVFEYVKLFSCYITHFTSLTHSFSQSNRAENLNLFCFELGRRYDRCDFGRETTISWILR